MLFRSAAKLVPIEDDAVPIDPVQENQNVLTGKPVKAFVEQNHPAHIAAHQAFIQSPMIQQMAQQNPAGQQQIMAMMAHINEHIAFDYRLQVEKMIGHPLPPVKDKNSGEHERFPLPPEVADQIAMVAAQATQQIAMQQNQAAQQQAAQQQLQDPVIQMQMQELQLKQQELQLKAQKQQIEAAEKDARIRIEQDRINAQKEIAAMQVGANAAAARDKLNKQSEIEGVRMGIDTAKHRAQMAVHRAQRAAQQQPPKKENK